MYDLMALAFQGDLTRVSTFVVANEGSNRAYPFIDVPDGHHDLSHHGGDPEKQAKIREINRFHVDAVGLLPGEAARHLRGRAIAARQLDGPLRQRPRRRQRPQSRQSADLAGWPRRRHAYGRAATSAATTRRRSTTCTCRCSTGWSHRSRRWATARAVSTRCSKSNPVRTTALLLAAPRSIMPRTLRIGLLALCSLVLTSGCGRTDGPTAAPDWA